MCAPDKVALNTEGIITCDSAWPYTITDCAVYDVFVSAGAKKCERCVAGKYLDIEVLTDDSCVDCINGCTDCTKVNKRYFSECKDQY
jgi:hypothetical protein